MSRNGVICGGLRAAALVVATAFVVLGTSAGPAAAHAELIRSDPPNGGMVGVGRTELTFWFTEGVNVGGSAFDLRTLDGVEVESTVSGADAEDGGVVHITTQPLSRATYVLDWRVLSADDGHATRGEVVFGAGVRPVAVSSGGTELPGKATLAVRAVDLAAIMLAIGAVAVARRGLGARRRSDDLPIDWARRRAQLIGLIAAGVAVASGALTPLVGTQQSGASLGNRIESAWSTLTGTSWGQQWMLREAMLALAAVVLWLAVRRPGGPRLAAAAAALAGAAWFEAAAGHSSSLPTRSGLATAMSAAHILAAGVWAGGLIVLALCLVPTMRRHPASRRPLIASAWRDFSPMAAVSSIVLPATGLYQAGVHVPGLGSVTSTVYGGTVAVKLALIFGALALATLNTVIVNPGIAATLGRALGRPAGWTPIPERRFAALAAAEAGVLALAVAAAAIVTTVPTAREISAASKPTAPHNSNIDGLFTTFEEVPAGPERSRLIVKANWTIKPEPAPVIGVEVTLAGPDGVATGVALQPFELGRYEGETAKPGPGQWTATVDVHRDGMTDAVMQVSWTVVAPGSEGPRPLEVATTTAATALLVLLGAGIGLARRRRRLGDGDGDQAVTTEGVTSRR